MSHEIQKPELPLGNHPKIRRVAGLLLTGLATAIPVMGTIWLLVVIYRVLLRLGDVIIQRIFMILNGIRWYGDGGDSFTEWQFDFFGANLVRFLLPVFLLLLFGFGVTSQSGHRLWKWLENTMQRVPYLGYIYSALKQFVDAVRDLGGERKFKGVAYIEYPSPGCRLLGFITGNYHDPQTGKDVTSILIPTSPSPLTGFVVIVDDDKVQKNDMTLEEATKMIVSAGLVAPASFDK